MIYLTSATQVNLLLFVVGRYRLLIELSILVSCGHQASHYFFSRTILDPKLYKAVECIDETNFESHLCDKHEIAYMGDGVSEEVQGTFYLSTDENGEPVD
jgi:hypothetical protein